MTSSTAVLSAEPATTAGPVAGLHACLDHLQAYDVEGLDASGHAEFVREIARAESRLAGLRFRALASAERSQVASVTGAASTGQWAAGLANADQAATHRQVRLAQGLEQRTLTRRALASGEVSPRHAAVIVQADRDLPTGVTPAQRRDVEAALVEKAKVLSPGALRRAARRSLAAVEADAVVVDAHENALVATEEERARERTSLTLHDNHDGTVTGRFTVPTAQGHLLRKILETMTAPRRARLGASQAQAGAPRGAVGGWEHARGLAFCELVEHLPTDHLHPKTAATVVVSLDHDTLVGALKVAHLDTGAELSAGEARRLACGARILPAVFGGASLPLDLGRSARLYSEAQRLALGLRHNTCAADGCERPFAWCELHHLTPWSQGGETDLAEAVPLCHFHHQRIHDPGFRHRWDGRVVSFHRTTAPPGYSEPPTVSAVRKGAR